MSTVDPVSQGSSTQANSGMQGAPQVPAGGTIPSTLKSIDDLKDSSPEGKKLYNNMLVGIATTIVNKMKDHQEHLKELWRKMSGEN